MAYFNPAKAIVVRVEASYHEGLSAGLFQDTGNGLQPVHFISRSMTDTEKRYSQTDKDALSIHWAKNRFSIYLLGAPKFKIIGQCYECQVTTKQHRQEPIKVTDIPKKPWDVISVDFSGPYPDGHYNLVAIDKRTRYPEVMKTHSTAFQPTMEKLKTMFATHGTP